MNFQKVFNKTMGWNILRESYKALLGLDIMIDNNNLKYDGQYPRLIYTSAMLIKIFKHLSSLTITLRYFQDILSKPGINKLLLLTIALLNSSIEKENHIMAVLVGISFKIS